MRGVVVSCGWSLSQSPHSAPSSCVAASRERVSPGRWAAVLVGFASVLAIAKPFGAGFKPATPLALLAAAFVAASRSGAWRCCRGNAEGHITRIHSVGLR